MFYSVVANQRPPQHTCNARTASVPTDSNRYTHTWNGEGGFYLESCRFAVVLRVYEWCGDEFNN